MENANMKHLSGARCVGLLVFYFLGYTYILPRILTVLTLMINPHATTFYIPFSVCAYLLVMGFVVWLAKPVWQDSLVKFKANWKKYLPMIFLLVFVTVMANYLLNVIVSIITQTGDSENQKVIVDNAMVAPAFTIFSSVIFAPIVEETVFRGGVFTFLRGHTSFISSLLLSSLLFGFIHVMDSLLAGNFTDVTYLLLYTGIGMVLAYGYEKSNSIVVSTGVHMCNNILAILSLFLTL